MGDQKPDRINPTGEMFANAIRALAEIDRELGMPEDGCNSTQATLAAIRLLHSAHRDDVANNQRLTTLLLETVSRIEGYKRAGWLTSGAAIQEANDLIGRIRRTTVPVTTAVELLARIDERTADSADAVPNSHHE